MAKTHRKSLVEPMALRKADAAMFCGVSIPTFDELVSVGTLPAPRCLTEHTKIWVKDELTAALMDLPNEASDKTNSLDFLFEGTPI
ncbi:MAG: hypothetical protein O3A90_14360 [Proteobacteria bacterium]|jgi:predicted DNA-binding transcriptional regulator AlpA|nr:hypothetical protein [Pseudomonadota bacterium]